jgi:hypothetical protein
VLEAAGANAVGALLVFLNLLERQPERFGYVGLAHVEHKPAHPNATADMLVYGINLRDHSCYAAGPIHVGPFTFNHVPGAGDWLAPSA